MTNHFYFNLAVTMPRRIMTRSRKEQIAELRRAFTMARMLSQDIPDSSDGASSYRRQGRERARARRERNLWSRRRKLSAGEVRYIVQLRFGQVGSDQLTGLSYGQIKKLANVSRQTAQSVCRAYLRRGLRILSPG